MNIIVNTIDVASIGYPKATYCITESDAVPTINGAVGTFSSLPIGLIINDSTGIIGVSSSSASSYNVSYTTSGVCPLIANTTIVIDLCTGIQKSNADFIRVFPNPASTVITIENSTIEVSQIRLVNILGETVVTKNIHSNKTIIGVDQLPMGIYIIQLYSPKGEVIYTQKISVK